MVNTRDSCVVREKRFAKEKASRYNKATKLTKGRPLK